MLLNVDVTGKCNLRCETCYNSEFRAYELEYADIERIIFESPPSVDLYYLGGEPLTRPDFQQILCLSVSSGHHTSFCTNGTLLSRVQIDRILDSGVHVIYVSLDGPSSESNDLLRGRGAFDKCIRGLTQLHQTIEYRDLDTQLCLSVTATNLNWRSLIGVPKLLHSLGISVEKLGVAPVMTIGFQSARPDLKITEIDWITLCEALCSEWKSFPQLSYLCLANPELVVRYLETKYTLVLPESISDCPIIHKRDIGRVLASGEIVPCSGRMDLLRKYQGLWPPSGSLDVSGLRSLPDAPFFSEFIEFGASHTRLGAKICRGCLFKETCEVCPMENFFRLGWRNEREKACTEVMARMIASDLKMSSLVNSNGSDMVTDPIRKGEVYFKSGQKGKEMLFHPCTKRMAKLNKDAALAARVLMESGSLNHTMSSLMSGGIQADRAVIAAQEAVSALLTLGALNKEPLS